MACLDTQTKEFIVNVNSKTAKYSYSKMPDSRTWFTKQRWLQQQNLKYKTNYLDKLNFIGEGSGLFETFDIEQIALCWDWTIVWSLLFVFSDSPNCERISSNNDGSKPSLSSNDIGLLTCDASIWNWLILLLCEDLSCVLYYRNMSDCF